MLQHYTPLSLCTWQKGCLYFTSASWHFLCKADIIKKKKKKHAKGSEFHRAVSLRTKENHQHSPNILISPPPQHTKFPRYAITPKTWETRTEQPHSHHCSLSYLSDVACGWGAEGRNARGRQVKETRDDGVNKGRQRRKAKYLNCKSCFIKHVILPPVLRLQLAKSLRDQDATHGAHTHQPPRPPLLLRVAGLLFGTWECCNTCMRGICFVIFKMPWVTSNTSGTITPYIQRV